MSEWTEGVFRHMNVRLVKDTQRCRRDEWTNWAERKTTSIRSRANKKSLKPRISKPLKNWKEACSWMLCAARLRVTRAKKGEWERWSLTTACSQRVRITNYPGPVENSNKYVSSRFEPRQRVKPEKIKKSKPVPPRHKIIDKYGFQMLMTEFNKHAEERGLKARTCYHRVKRNGMSLMEAITEPLGGKLRSTKIKEQVTKNGKTQLVLEWLKECGISRKTFERRVRNKGWSIDRAATQPVDKAAQRRSIGHARGESESKGTERVDREAAV
jgi:hypothetical protein